MTVLSDAKIRAEIVQGRLVPGGNPDWAEECSYSFRPGRAFMAGEDGEPVDFLNNAKVKSITVYPGKMVWIRTRDRVVMPHTHVGFWWQTNTLSRKGLMLVNMSMVEPGYDGDLACLLVNFGSGKVIISADTVIAKMVFVGIEGKIDRPFDRQSSTSEYDARLREMAINQPSSFLQIGDLADNIAQERRDALAAVQRSVDDARAVLERQSAQGKADAERAIADAISHVQRVAADARGSAEQALVLARAEAIETFKSDAPKAARRTFGWAGLGFVLLTLASLVSTWFKDNAFEDQKKLARGQAEEVLRERLSISATPSIAENVALQRRVRQLSERLAKLEKK